MPASELDFRSIQPPGLGDGSVAWIRPEVGWLRMPVPGRLECINVWALAGTEGWTIADTGLRSPETIAAWRRAFCGALSSATVKEVCVTHLHPDHVGLAGWLHDQFGATLNMTRLEYYMLRTLVADSSAIVPESALRFYRSAGWSEAELDLYRARFGEFSKAIYALPQAFRGLRAGDRISTGHTTWEVIIGRGHSPEHALLYCAERKLLISGDQVPPRISSNVSVHPQEPFGDPLTDWLGSLVAIREQVPDDVLILPAHGQPFHGLHTRISDLIDGHEQGLKRLTQLLISPKRVIDVFSALFRRQIDESVLMMATGESLAHLSCLRTRGLAQCEDSASGESWWRLCEGVQSDEPLRSPVGTRP